MSLAVRSVFSRMVMLTFAIAFGVHAAASDSSRTLTLTVATANSSETSKQAADFVGDGHGDQEEINEAIRALPNAGGTVQLMEGTYDIRKVNGKLGGILIERSHVVLQGQGRGARLVLAPGQNTNVIRIIGSGVAYVTIRDLIVDANRDENGEGTGDPNVSHSRFEFCGIKAFYTEPGGPTGERNHDITIENCHVYDAHRLGIMLEGANMKVINNVLGNAGSDAVEILTGPGEIRGNYAEITGPTHVAIGSDRGDNILMSDNIVHVKNGGALDIAFRSWANSKRHVIANNIVTVDEGGRCGIAVDARGEGAVVHGNNFHTSNTADRMRLVAGAGNTIILGNIFENVTIEINDTTGANKPIVVKDNVMANSMLEHKRGRLIQTTEALLDAGGTE